MPVKMEASTSIVDACPSVFQGSSSQMFMLLINTLFAAKCQLNTQFLYPKDYAQHLNNGDEFDFIVVGSGSAGSLVASRLSEVKKWKVLLIEAGDYPLQMTEVPAMGFTLKGTANDWGYKMAPSTSYCTGLKSKACPCPRGKGLGGSTLINAMMYIRSTRNDHDRWVQAGNAGWDYDTITQHYRNFENVQSDDHHGKHGELNISAKTIDVSVLKATRDAYAELGYSDYTEEHPIGYHEGLLTISEGTRQNTAKAFLSKAKDRQNLYVALNTQVGRLLFNEDKTLVTGVEIKTNGIIKTLRATKEVILSAGSINSPHILLNSGIGPKDHLNKMGIEIIRNLQVGENLQDHVAYPGFIASIDAPDLGPISPLAEVDQLYQYLVHKKGPLTMMGSMPAGYIHTENVADRANLQIVHFAFHPKDPNFTKYASLYDLTDKIVTKIWETNLAITCFIIIMLNPESRGRIILHSNDAYEPPLIVPNFLSKTNDMQVMVKGIKYAKKMLQTKAFAQFKPKLRNLDLPGCKFRFDSDEYWECAIRNIGQTLFHPVGTCKMGPATDPTAVVSPQLKVHSLKGVRVVDGSIMPTITSANTNAPIIMIGEMGAHLIKTEWLAKKDEL